MLGVLSIAAGTYAAPPARAAAMDSAGNVVTSTDPTGGAASWKLTKVDGSNDLSGISCPTVSLCVAVDVWGKAVIGVKHRAHDHRDRPGD